MPAWAGGRSRGSARRGRTAYQSGLAAEEAVARLYEARGDTVLARRYRTAEGEIDLVVRSGETLVFVEVKRRKRLHAFDSPVSEAQWRRLECAALRYVIETSGVTCTEPSCRFDVALVGVHGQVDLVENARTFE